MMNTSQSDVIGTTRANPGETLRQARENKGWSTAQVAGQLNLTENALRQLEQGSFDQLPGHTFARGYIRAYAKLLGMDQAQMVTAFDQYTGTDASGSNVQALGRVVEPVRLSRNLLRLFSLALLAVLIGFGYFWWQERSARPAETGSLNMEHVEVESADGTTEIHTLDEPEDQAVAEDQANTPPVPSEPAGDSGNAEAPAEGTPPAAAAPGVPTAPEAVPAPAPAAPALAQPPAAQQPAVPANPAAPAEAPAAPVVAAAGQGVVKVQFIADCWTQVTDADGKVILEGLKRKGDSLEVAAKAPVQLRLGFAQGAQVSYNGQPVEVTPARGGTARLKLGGQ
ncbi:MULTISPECIES: helix-turn-helix domain-containing protein [Pseudomonas]|uniref:helix-turn-helix domain-containing protein n=1 Tax=Pseudomonas TaxID=286 RepID=UPI0006D4398D|nr:MULTISPECIES: RodZ family helix-turn-helix domain-containing protein [Pseudomonas]MCE4071251.1 helix-turn-helix domain-containing protein [Pseudomonas nitritireducens]MCE4080866.1 helix-turn-helix domain-containing protein [Pseudomonas nitroreducens]OBY90796.1 Cro/Cl family transcriptional regulator [Pseudomonas sp. AU11447]